VPLRTDSPLVFPQRYPYVNAEKNNLAIPRRLRAREPRKESTRIMIDGDKNAEGNEPHKSRFQFCAGLRAFEARLDTRSHGKRPALFDCPMAAPNGVKFLPNAGRRGHLLREHLARQEAGN
jgi:hypothetical protein